MHIAIFNSECYNVTMQEGGLEEAYYLTAMGIEIGHNVHQKMHLCAL